MFSAFKKFGRMGGGSSIPWTPTKLFAAGEKGGLWDFSTLANLYQDSAGTTPCTAVGQPIGKVLDTSGRGNHLTQATSTKRPTLGRMPATGVRNLLTYTEDFSNAVWGKAGMGYSGSTLIPTAVSSQHFISINTPQSGTPANTLSIVAKAAGYHWLGLAVSSGGVCTFDLLNGVVGTTNTTGGTPSIVSIGGGYYRCSLTRNYATQTSYVFVEPDDSQATWTPDGISGIEVYPQLELGSTPTAYQKVGAAYDVTESGVASVYTAYFDGVDDCLVSPSIDFTGTDKMSVFAGARKVDDTAGVAAELSTDVTFNQGNFYLVSGTDAGHTGWQALSGGSIAATSGQVAYSTISGPDTAVLSSQHNIPGDLSTIRRNGVAGTSGTGDKGTGNFGNYPIYVGQRAAATLPYKGFLSALCTRGAATDAALVTSMEKWLAARTPGVTLP